MTSPPRGIDERAFRFVCDVIRFVRTVRPEPGVRRLIDQLVGAAGSIAANGQEANSASSRRQFTRYNEIAPRSAKEAFLWLRVFKATAIGSGEKLEALVDEGGQLALILGSIVIKTKGNEP